MELFDRKRQVNRHRTPSAERLEQRLIFGAPLALTSDGLLLAGPEADELLEPALFADAAGGSVAGTSGPAADTSTGPVVPLPDPSEPVTPEEDPLSPVGDPEGGALGDGASTMSGSCCQGGITFMVWVECIRGVSEWAGTEAGLFRFSAVASCSAGAPASINVTYTRTDVTATANTDYEGGIAASNSVSIPLTNGSGTKEVGWNAKQDLIDEADQETMKVRVNYTAVIKSNPAVPIDAVGTVADDDVEWAVGDPIQGSITTTAGDNPAICVNSTLGLTATATDVDRVKNNLVWSDYYDDVTSGNTATDHHIAWSASEGKFAGPGGVPTNVAYGTDVTYLAPPYEEGKPERTVTITATVDDINRGTDTAGFNDAAVQIQSEVKVWEVHVTVRQDGQTSDRYDGAPVPVNKGGTDLGWVEVGNPHGADSYRGNTEVKGSLPGSAPPTGYTWRQEVKKLERYKMNGEWHIRANTQWEADGVIGINYLFEDTDARHPNGDGTDFREIFLLDAPGVRFGNTQAGNVPPDGWTDFEFSYTLRTWVMFGVDCSNVEYWSVGFKLRDVNGVWAVNGVHTP
jgi:hypothetical protein